MKEVPLFPLNTVLFPDGRLPLRIFEQRYMKMAKACLRDSTPFGVCLIVEGSEVGAPAVPAAVGCLARLETWDMPQLGVLQVTAAGTDRFRIVQRRVETDGSQLANIEMLAPDTDSAVPDDCARCVKLLERVMEQQPGLFESPRLGSASWVGCRLAELLPLPNQAKQELLELTDARLRVQRLNDLLRSD